MPTACSMRAFRSSSACRCARSTSSRCRSGSTRSARPGTAALPRLGGLMSDAASPLDRRMLAEALGTAHPGRDRRRLRHHGRPARRRKPGRRAARQHDPDRRDPRGADRDPRAVSGAHFNPAVTLVSAWRREMPWGESRPTSPRNASAVSPARLVAHSCSSLAADDRHDRAQRTVAMARRGRRDVRPGADDLGGVRYAPQAVPWLVGLVITAAYWFTASTSFANPAVTLARGFTTTFAGIAINQCSGFRRGPTGRRGARSRCGIDPVSGRPAQA